MISLNLSAAAVRAQVVFGYRDDLILGLHLFLPYGGGVGTLVRSKVFRKWVKATDFMGHTPNPMDYYIIEVHSHQGVTISQKVEVNRGQ